jgi:TolA-binding protein
MRLRARWIAAYFLIAALAALFPWAGAQTPPTDTEKKDAPPPGPVGNILLPLDDLLKSPPGAPPRTPPGTSPTNAPSTATSAAPPPPLPELIATATADFHSFTAALLHSKAKMTEPEANDYLNVLLRFDAGVAPDAESALKSFLKTHPNSNKAAEVLFRLAALETTSGRNAKKLHEDLIRDHPDSPWSQLVMKALLSENDLLENGRSFRKKALSSKSVPLAQAAKSALLACNQRAGQGHNPSRVRETLYLLIDVCQLLGDSASAGQAVGLLANSPVESKDCQWTKLARLRRAAPDRFVENLDELARMSGTQGEAPRAFNELYLAWHEQLKGDDAVRFRVQYAQDLCDLDQVDQGKEIYREIVKAHPQSRWAGEALFWLADETFSAKHFAEAKALYREFASRHPDHPRAESASRWLQGFDGRDKTLRELENALVATFKTWQASHFSLAFRGVYRSAGKDKFAAEFAARDAKHDRADVSFGDAGMVFVTSAKGTWLWDRLGPVRETATAPNFGAPRLKLGYNRATDQIGFEFMFGLEQASIEVDDPPLLAREVLKRLTDGAHVFAEDIPAGAAAKRRVVVEWSTPASPRPERLSIDMAASCAIVGANYETFDRDDVKAEIVLAPLTFGGAIPDDQFAPLRPAGVKVVRVESINVLTYITQGLQLGSDVFAALSKNGRK